VRDITATAKATIFLVSFIFSQEGEKGRLNLESFLFKLERVHSICGSARFISVPAPQLAAAQFILLGVNVQSSMERRWTSQFCYWLNELLSRWLFSRFGGSPPRLTAEDGLSRSQLLVPLPRRWLSYQHH
jgi:hypothetical protein